MKGVVKVLRTGGEGTGNKIEMRIILEFQVPVMSSGTEMARTRKMSGGGHEERKRGGGGPAKDVLRILFRDTTFFQIVYLRFCHTVKHF